MTSKLAAPTHAEQRPSIARLTRPGRRRLPMLRVVWRQHWGALSVVLTLTAIAIGALVLSERFNQRFPVSEWRAYLWQGYGPRYPDLAMQAIPLMAALFVGIPLISRELEDGTAQFAWTQGYGKARWALGKLAAAAAVLVPAAVVLGLVFSWWYRLYVPATGYFTLHAFALYAPALAGWTVAGLTLGMAAAALTRRELRARWLVVAGWFVLHHFAIVGSPRTRPGEFWPLQFVQLAILLAISGLFMAGVIALIQGVPAIAGMPRLLRALPKRTVADPQALARQLDRSRLLALPRAAWRQHRVGLLVALSVLGIYLGTLLITGLRIHADPARLRPSYDDLNGLYVPVGPVNANYLLPLVLPFVIGAFVGGSLTGTDLVQGTARFAWAQGVTRTRWAIGKLLAIGCVLVGAAAAVGLVFQWWDEPYLGHRLAEPWFGLYAPVYAGWMAVTLTMAAFLGALARSRTGAAVASMIVTLVFAFVNAEFLRPGYLPKTVAIDRPAPPGSFFINEYLRHAQRLPTPIAFRALANFDNAAGWTGIERALTKYHATNVFVYQAPSQFWQLQAIESTGLFAVALLFGAAAVWLVRRQDS